ncbi:MAG: RNA 3'-terminal phosphate cyclase, partial [Nanoarchaeota archaeon]
MIELDGSQGEGGGQMLRTALSLSAISGDAFRIKNIRAGREDPGLKAQHLAAIKAVQKLCGAVVDGAELGSTEITFYPKLLKGADVAIDIGTAGSITLVLQAAILPALFGLRISRFLISGGTDVAFAPTIDYFTEVFVPHIRTWCANIEVRVLKRGYFPVGKGVVEVIVQPKIFRDDYESFTQFMAMLQASVPKIDSLQQGHLVVINGVSHASMQGVAERQTETAQHLLAKKGRTQIRSEMVRSVSEGSGMTLWAMFSLQQDEMEFTRPIRLGASALG